MIDISAQLRQQEEEVIRLRRDFHQYPELGYKEFRTSEIVANYLEGCGLSGGHGGSQESQNRGARVRLALSHSGARGARHDAASGGHLTRSGLQIFQWAGPHRRALHRTVRSIVMLTFKP